MIDSASDRRSDRILGILCIGRLGGDRVGAKFIIDLGLRKRKLAYCDSTRPPLQDVHFSSVRFVP